MSSKKRVMILLAAFSIVGLLAILVFVTITSFQPKLYVDMDGPSFYKAYETGLLFDVRTEEEFAVEHVSGAVNIPVDDISSDSMQQYDIGENIYVYCTRGVKSKRACNKLVKLGYKHVFNLDGGITKYPIPADIVFSGIDNMKQEKVLNDRRPMVRVNDKIYMDTGKSVSTNIKDFSVAGNIISSVDGDKIPERNGESNFGCEGAEYAVCDDGLVIWLQNSWIYFEEGKS